MAKGKKTGGKLFGQDGHYSPGRPRTPEDIRAARKLTKAEFERTLNVFLEMTSEQLADKIHAPASTVLEKMIGSIVEKATEHGDQNRLNFILERLIGRVTDKIETKNLHVHEVKQMTDAELLAAAPQAIAYLKEKVGK